MQMAMIGSAAPPSWALQRAVPLCYPLIQPPPSGRAYTLCKSCQKMLLQVMHVWQWYCYTTAGVCNLGLMTGSDLCEEGYDQKRHALPCAAYPIMLIKSLSSQIYTTIIFAMSFIPCLDFQLQTSSCLVNATRQLCICLHRQ